MQTDNVATQSDDPSSLLSHYRSWIAARKGSSALSKGTITTLDAPAHILAFLRDFGTERVLVVHNVTAVAPEEPLAIEAAGFDVIQAGPGFSAPTGASGSWTVSVPAYGSAAWRLR